jgi:hypothetical protein
MRPTPLDEKGEVVADRAALEAAVFRVHEPRDMTGLYLRIDANESPCELVNHLLFTQLDHVIEGAPL